MEETLSYTTIFNEKIVSVFKKIELRYKITFLSTFLWGFWAHGMMFFNKYSLFDDSCSVFNHLGTTYTSGRWMLGVFRELENLLYEGYYYSLPLFYGVMSILTIVIINIFLIKLMEIRNLFSCMILSGIMITFPTICSLFGYMFTSMYYVWGFGLAIIGGYIVCYYSKWYLYLLGVLLMACSVGVYQSNTSIYISLIVVYLIKEVYDTKYTIKRFLTKCVYYMGAVILSVVLYFLINKVFLTVLHLSLSDYMGISNMGNDGILVYLQRILYAYRIFFFPSVYNRGDIVYFLNSIHLYRAILLFIFIFTGIILLKKFRENIVQALQIGVAVLFLPLGINFSYIITVPQSVYTLMIYSQVILYLYLIWLIEYVNVKIKKKYILQSIALLCTLALVFVFGKIANMCYLVADIKQQRTISYFTSLVADIKATDDYKDEYPVVFINGDNKKDLSFEEMYQSKWTTLRPYHLTMNDMTDFYAWEAFMVLWTGYKPIEANKDDFEDLPEVQAMPSYPDYGSIKVINKTVVVKF